MKRIEFKKYCDETDKRHSLLRLLSFRFGMFAILMSLILLGMNIGNVKIDVNLIYLNLSIYAISLGGKVGQKAFENKGVQSESNDNK